jgi:hypothetical protein
MNKQEAGRKGGTNTLRRYGKEHFRQIGKRGFLSFVNRYLSGNGSEAMAYLRKKWAELQLVRLADQEGQTCIETPVLLEPDDDVFFEPSWQERVRSATKEQRRR